MLTSVLHHKHLLIDNLKIFSRRSRLLAGSQRLPLRAGQSMEIRFSIKERKTRGGVLRSLHTKVTKPPDFCTSKLGEIAAIRVALIAAASQKLSTY